MNKLFAFDVDGTIFNSKERILPETIEALNEAKSKGHTLVVASGRGITDMQPVIDQAPGIFDYLVCNNGSYIVDIKSGKKYYDKEIDRKWFHEVVRVGRELKAFFAVHTTEGVRRCILWNEGEAPDWYPNVIDEEWHKFHIDKRIDDLAHFANNAPLMQLSLRATEKEIQDAEKLIKHHDDIDIHIANDVYLDVNPIGISKMSGIKTLIKKLNLSIDKVITFGDSGNDIQMLKGADKGYCMGNGNRFAKDVADEIIGTNNEPSIANAIMKNI